MKKLISLILVIFMTALLPISAFADGESNQISYDINGDGKVNMFDYIFIKGIYFGSIDTVPEFDGADVNGDGTVNIFDCVLVKQAYLSSDDQVVGEAKDIPYTAHGLSGSLEEYDSQGIRPEYGMELDSFLVSDFEQLDALLDIFLDYHNSTRNAPFIDFIEALSEDYFESKALVITPVYASTGTAYINIENVRANGHEIITEISVIGYGEGTDDCQNRLMTAEVNKSDIAGCTSARAEIVELNVYGTNHYFYGNVLFVEDCELPHRLIVNSNQLNELASASDPFGSSELTEYLRSLPEDFFNTKVLAITEVVLPDGSYFAYTAATTYGKQGLTVHIDRWSRTDGSYVEVVSYMFAVTELDRADIGDVSTFNAKYVD